jgi:small subunit ribosomal protein S21
MYVKVDNEKDGLTKALRIFSRMVKKAELIQEIRNRQHYLKPSVKKAFKQKEAFRRRKREERREARQNRYNN